VSASPTGGPRPPSLSAVMVAGPLRERAERTLAGLRRQTALERIEVIVVDAAGPDSRRLRVPEGLPAKRLELAEPEPGEERAAAIGAARSPVIAFIEDHSVPDPGWAESLIEAHRGPWSAVGYAFTVPEPSNYISRAGLVSEAGAWMHPARRRRVRSLPTTNVSVKRDALLEVAGDTASFLLYGHVLHGQLGRAGQPMLLEPGAVIAHEYLPRLMPLLLANYGHGRLLGHSRAASWGSVRRAVWALGTPLSAPVVRAARLIRGLGRPRAAARALASAPVLVLAYAAAALGEALGYVLGAGAWAERIERYERREPRMDAIATEPHRGRPAT
jgi:Glycosyl transferase family 2